MFGHAFWRAYLSMISYGLKLAIGKDCQVGGREIEQSYKTDWLKYDNGIIPYEASKEHVDYYARQMERHDKNRAAEM